jgi:hypothetical protein
MSGAYYEEVPTSRESHRRGGTFIGHIEPCQMILFNVLSAPVTSVRIRQKISFTIFRTALDTRPFENVLGHLST